MIVVTDRHGQLMQTNLSDLEERIGEIRHLDEQRAQIRDFIRRGKAALREALIGRRRSYANPRDLVEKSLVLHLFRDDPEAGQRLRFTELTETGPSLFFEALDREKGALGGTSDNVPVLRSAVVLDTLSHSVDRSFSLGSIGAYCRILYELYKTTEPDEMLGGASAGGNDVQQTAFVTLCCLRSMLAFAEAFDGYRFLLLDIARLNDSPTDSPTLVPDKWWQEHFKILARSTEISISLRKSLLCANPHVKAAPGICGLFTKPANGGLAAFKTEELSAFKTVMQKAFNAITAAQDYYEHDQAPKKNPYCQRIVLASLANLSTAVQAMSQSEDNETIATQLKQIAQDIRKRLRPTLKFMESVLDHELAATSQDTQRVPDCAELLFAALGAAKLGKTQDPRLLKALSVARAILPRAVEYQVIVRLTALRKVMFCMLRPRRSRGRLQSLAKPLKRTPHQMLSHASCSTIRTRGTMRPKAGVMNASTMQLGVNRGSQPFHCARLKL
jgi:hypothetical protein